MYKYGVVRVDDLIQDILDWKTFYLSGRLQKPVGSIFLPLLHVLISSSTLGLFSKKCYKKSYAFVQ